MLERGQPLTILDNPATTINHRNLCNKMAPFNGADQRDDPVDAEFDGNNEGDEDDRFIDEDQISILNTDNTSVMRILGQIAGFAQGSDISMPIYYTFVPSREERIYLIDSIVRSRFGGLEIDGDLNDGNNDESNDGWSSDDDSVPSLMSHTTADRISNWIDNPTKEDMRCALMIQIAWRRFKLRRD